ncbi:hypothetical protein HF519_29170 [Pseudonocardia bannensis]|uniref:Rho termination factor N-terminal domain-containing protein n=1 Tax=Pseudonocardia bannensis TaxID=630973 RepID=A0A848DT42_9PSEU|nr:hypothetical protein [Pseudonocardia bannensis]
MCGAGAPRRFALAVAPTTFHTPAAEAAGEPDLAAAIKADLIEMARELGVKGRSKMKRAELEKAVTEASGAASAGRRRKAS